MKIGSFICPLCRVEMSKGFTWNNFACPECKRRWTLTDELCKSCGGSLLSTGKAVEGHGEFKFTEVFCHGCYQKSLVYLK